MKEQLLLSREIMSQPFIIISSALKNLSGKCGLATAKPLKIPANEHDGEWNSNNAKRIFFARSYVTFGGSVTNLTPAADCSSGSYANQILSRTISGDDETSGWRWSWAATEAIPALGSAAIPRVNTIEVRGPGK